MLESIKLIVLDRDGVINCDSADFIKSPAEWHALPGSLDAIAKLAAAGYRVVVATNQSGIARGYFTVEELHRIHQKMYKQIEAHGGHIDDVFICPHGPKDNCECRKPKAGLLKKIAAQYALKPSEMLIIGDSSRDILAAKTFGAPAILVETGNGKQTALEFKAANAEMDIPIYADLAAVVDAILDKSIDCN